MIVLERKISKEELKQLAKNYFGDMIKGVVDVDRNILALDAELHSDLESLLLQNGSEQYSLWGINLYPELSDDDFLEFDSLINIRPHQGNVSRDVEDDSVKNRIRKIVNSFIVR